jgi:hypothetical protein
VIINNVECNNQQAHDRYGLESAGSNTKHARFSATR